MSSDYKTSFMVDQKYLDKFLIYMKEIASENDRDSRFQLGKFSIDGHDILVYKSGIVIFEDHQPTKVKISTFLERYEIDNPDFEQYRAINSEEKQTTGWDETPKGVWLTDDQLTYLRNHLDQSLNASPGEKHELCRYVKGEQILVLNNNGVVYTIGGFEGIIEILRNVITTVNPYKDFQRILVFDEKGRWEKIGPVCVCIVDITQTDVIELQLEGIKDDSKSRATDHIEQMELVESHCTYYSHVIEPREINQESKDRENYLSWVNQEIHSFLEAQDLQINDQTLIICDKNLLKLLPKAVHVVPITRDARDHPALGVSSTIVNAHIQQWTTDWYRKRGYRPERHNMNQIRDDQYVNQLAKVFLL